MLCQTELLRVFSSQPTETSSLPGGGDINETLTVILSVRDTPGAQSFREATAQSFAPPAAEIVNVVEGTLIDIATLLNQKNPLSALVTMGQSASIINSDAILSKSEGKQ